MKSRQSLFYISNFENKQLTECFPPKFDLRLRMKKFWSNNRKIKYNFAEKLLHVCILLKHYNILSMQQLKYCFLTKLTKIGDVKVTVNKRFLRQFFSLS